MPISKRRTPESSQLDLSILDRDDLTGRSPRTPTYAPNSPSFAALSPFDPSKRFSFGPHQISPSKLNFISTPRRPKLPPSPAKPLAWVWQCHLCHSRWNLGATRRCLLDGHFYCSGEASQPNLKKRRKGQSCSSELDYVGWQDWIEWKKKVQRLTRDDDILAGCQACEFPSQCRYVKAAKRNPAVVVPGQSLAKTSTETAAESTSRSRARRRNEELDVDDLSKYYSGDETGPSLDELVAQVLSARRLSEEHDMESADAPPTGAATSEDSITGTRPARLSKKKNVRSRSIGDNSKDYASGSLQDLVMPLMEYLSGSKNQ